MRGLYLFQIYFPAWSDHGKRGPAGTLVSMAPPNFLSECREEGAALSGAASQGGGEPETSCSGGNNDEDS